MSSNLCIRREVGLTPLLHYLGQIIRFIERDNMDHRVFFIFDVLSIFSVKKFLLGCFSIYAKMRNLERSDRTGFKPGERSNLSSSQPSPSTFRRAWWGCTIGISSYKSPQTGTFTLHGSLRVLGTQISSDMMVKPSSCSGHRSFPSCISSLHVFWIRNCHSPRLTRPTYCGVPGTSLVSDAGRPLRWFITSWFLNLGPFPLQLSRTVLGIRLYPSYPGWIPQSSTLPEPLEPHVRSGI